MEKKSLGTFLAVLRKANGLTQRQLAERLNVSDKAVSRWERDESAPDLSLIPVIADIFGVTADELLRGERSGLAANPEQAAARTEKQLRHLLKAALTRYKICSCISVAVALLGLIGAMILNLGFLKGYVGFFVSCAFFIAALLCQTIFQILGHNAVTADELDSTLTAPARKCLFLGGELVFGTIFVLFCTCLPLILFPIGPFAGLTAGYWVKCGALGGLAAAALWLVACTAINCIRGYWHLPDLRSPRNRLRLRHLGRGVLILLLLILLHTGTVTLINRNFHLLGGEKFDNWDDFRRYMELPRDTDGTPLTFLTLEGTGNDTRYIYENAEGEAIVFHKEVVSRQLYATAEDESSGAEPLVRYRHLNRNITSVHPGRSGLPVTVLNQTHTWILRVLTACVHLLWGFGYFQALKKALRKYRAEVNDL